MLSLLLYAGFAVCAAGALSVIQPLRVFGLRRRWSGAVALAVGVVAVSVILSWPVQEVRVANPVSALDTFAPVYQFREQHSIAVRATPGQVYSAIKSVSADEIPFYRQLVWIRRGGNQGPGNILNPPDGVPLVRVATASTFLLLADRVPHEFVMGTVVIAPRGVRLALGSTPESYQALTQPGFAKATLAFQVEARPNGTSVLRTETRVAATDYVSRATFARYWRVIAPGSSFVRLMWLRAVKIRAESAAGGPVPPRASNRWLDIEPSRDTADRIAVSRPDTAGRR